MAGYPRNIFLFSLLIFCVLAYHSTWSQNAIRIQQIKDSLIASDQHTVRYRLMNELGLEYASSFPDSTIYYATLVSEQTNQDPALTLSMLYQGLGNQIHGKVSAALTLYESAIKRSEVNKDSLMLAKSQNYLGRFYLNIGNLAKAYENINHARLYFEKERNLMGLSEVFISLSELFISQHDYDNALDMAKKAHELKKKIGDDSGIIQSHIALGSVYHLAGDFAQSEINYRTAESISSRIEDEVGLAVVKLGLGQLYLESGSFAKAESESFRAENIIQRLNNPGISSQASLLLGRVFLKKKNYELAESYLQKAYELSGSLQQLAVYMETNFYLARVYELTGKDSKVAGFESTYRKLNDSIRNNELALQAEKFNFELAIKTSEQENAILITNEQKNEATINFQRVINLGALLIIALVLFFSYFLWRGTMARKKVNKKLYIQNQQLIDLNNEKDALMGVVAHDLKTPFANIKSILGMLPTFGSLSARQVEFTNLIQDSSEAGLNLIDELLDVHTLESQKLPKQQSVDLNNLLETRVNNFKTSAKAKEIKLSLELKNNILLMSDADWLNRILDNLISNAIKFSPSQKEVIVSSGITAEEVWISVKDQGPGFTDDDRIKVFQKFNRLTAKPTGGESSNGLGLAIVKTLVERLNGTISLISENGEGAEFIVRLPINT